MVAETTNPFKRSTLLAAFRATESRVTKATPSLMEQLNDYTQDLHVVFAQFKDVAAKHDFPVDNLPRSYDQSCAVIFDDNVAPMALHNAANLSQAIMAHALSSGQHVSDAPQAATTSLNETPGSHPLLDTLTHFNDTMRLFKEAAAEMSNLPMHDSLQNLHHNVILLTRKFCADKPQFAAVLERLQSPADQPAHAAPPVPPIVARL